MKKLIVIIPALALLIGCKTTSFLKQAPDGSIVKVKDTRVFTATSANIDAEVLTNGTWKVKAAVSSSQQAEVFKAVAEGVASGLKK